MTTIAWDGTTLAGDSLAAIDGCLAAYGLKVYVLTDGRLYGASGRYQDVLAVRMWLDTGGEKPHITEFAGMVIETNGECSRIEESLVFMPIREPFHAVGSGRDFALAAMALGQTAAQAVALAARFDIYTGGGVVEVSLLGGASAQHQEDVTVADTP